MERNVPKLRFKGFNDEWENKKLGEFLTFYSTNSFSRDCLNYENGDAQNIHYGDIHMKFPTILDTEKTIFLTLAVAINRSSNKLNRFFSSISCHSPFILHIFIRFIGFKRTCVFMKSLKCIPF